MIVTFAISIIELVSRYSEMFSLGWKWVEGFYSSLPLSAYSLTWLPVSIIVFAAARWFPCITPYVTPVRRHDESAKAIE